MLSKETRNAVEAVYPLSPVQQGMLFYSAARSKDENDMYVIQWSCAFPETLSPTCFERAWQRVVERHAVLRTAFLWQDLEVPLQIVGRRATIHVELLDWSQLAAEQFQAALTAWLAADQARGFALTSAPLMRLTLVRQPDLSYRFIWSYHHLLLDGWSWPLVLREVFAFYEAFTQQRELVLPDPRPYKDYIAWLQAQDLAQAEAFWRHTLSGFSEATPLNIARPIHLPTSGASRYRVLETHFSIAETQSLATFARQRKITLNTLMQGAWAILLRAYSGRDEVVFGTVVSGRPFEMDGVENMVGMFINTLPARIRISDKQTCEMWLQEIQLQQLEARQYEYSPLVQVQKWSEVPSGQPLFESLLVYENYPIDEDARAHGLKLQVSDVAFQGLTNYPLTLCVESGRELVFRLGYDEQRFDAQAMQWFNTQFQQILRAILADARQPVADLSLLSQAERAFVLHKLNQTSQLLPPLVWHEFFEEQVRRAPEAIAAQFGETSLSYGELNRRANWFAHRLRGLGVGPETLVGLYVERSLDLLVGLLAILKAGGAYVPLDPTTPHERLAYILEDTHLAVMLTQWSLGQSLPAHTAQVLYLDQDWRTIPGACENPPLNVTPDNLAYIIYTSGSTGQPKGVMVPHRGVVNIIQTQRARVTNLSERDRVLQFASICFDASVWEICLALASGACLYLGSREELEPGPALVNFLSKHEISLASLPPAVLASLRAEDRLPKLRAIFTGGESCSREVVQRWGQQRAFYDFYGPTETTIVATGERCALDLDIAPPIGRPVLNTQAYLLDEQLAPVHLGGVGELYIGGLGVTRGYLARPDLTAERFLPDPFSDEPGTRLYKTGDLARYLGDGQLEYLGRNDQQVKIRGYRIELGEIDAVLKQHPAVRDAVTLVHQCTSTKRLVAYLLAEKERVSVSELRQFLQTRLPDYMVPARFVYLAAFPLTLNGKVDRQALANTGLGEKSEPISTRALPRTPAQQALVEVWQRVLGRAQIGIDDNFFELGGDSILSLQIVAGAAQVGLELTPRHIFQYPTIAELALCAQQVDQQSIQERQEEVEGVLSLTPVQRWFLEQEWDNPHHCNQAQLCMVPPDLDPRLLEEALHALVEHHDALRLRFARLAGGDWQAENLPARKVPFALEQHDLSALAQEEQIEVTQNLLRQAHSSLHLSQGPLFRAVYLAYGRQPGRLLLVAHHMVIDMVSWRLLIEDLETAYAQRLRGQEIQLPPRTSSFKSWAEQLARYAQQSEVENELTYWQGVLQEDSARLPVDHPGGQNNVASTGVVEMSLPVYETQALLQTVPAMYRTQINDALLLALARTLTAWSGQNAILIDLEGHGRENIGGQLDVSRTVGWFTTVFPVCLKDAAQGDIGQALLQIKEQLRALPRHGIGYGALRYLNLRGKKLLQPAHPAEVSFNYLGQFDSQASGGQHGHFSPAPEFSGVPHSPQAPRLHLLDLAAYVRAGRLHMTWEYSQEIHQRATVERLARAYLNHLRELIQHCQQTTHQRFTPSDFPLAKLDQQQLDRLLAGREIENLYPLSPLQQGLLFHTLYAPDAGTYLVQSVWKLEGQLDVDALGEAWYLAIARHPILRTSFAWEHLTEPLQLVHRAGRLQLQQLDWRDTDPQKQQVKLDHLLTSERERDFDLDQPTQMRLSLVRVRDDAWYFVENFHHILLDGWSAAQLQQEVLQTYLALSQQDSLNLEPARAYSDYIAWLQQQDLARAEQFWRKMLRGIDSPTPLGLELEGAEHSEAHLGYGQQTCILTSALTARLQSLARRLHITLNTVLQGAWAFLLSRYSGERAVIYGTTVAGRPTSLVGSERMMGLFINTLPMRVLVDSAASGKDWLQALQEQLSEVQQFDYCSLVQIQQWSDMPQNLPLFKSLLVFENYRANPPERLGTEARLSLKQMRQIEQTSYPLAIVIAPEETLNIQAIYERKRCADGTVSTVLEHLQAVLAAWANDPEQPLACIDYLNASERALLRAAHQQTASAFPRAQTIHQRFNEQATRFPSSIAVEYDGNTLTYAELNQRANQLAGYLRACGVRPGNFVALYLERSLEMIVALLGILKAGGAYVPLDLAYPPDRLAFMLADTAAPVLLTDSTLAKNLPAYQGKQLCLDTLNAELSLVPEMEGEEYAGAEYPAYVIYTSGSTGIPKGVCVPHQAVLRLVCETNYMPFHAGQRFAQASNASFDAATFEIWGALLHGGRLIGISREVMLSPEDFARELREKEISALFVTTALFNQMARLLPTIFQSIETVLTGGEAIDARSIQTVLREGAPRRLLHVYGPTECTTYATWSEISPAAAENAVMPIGRPLSNTTCFVLDAYLRPVPVGVPGELYLGGEGLALGYWQRPEITAQRFIPCPWGDRPGARLYRTGDLVRVQPDGQIVFLARLDSQVKLRGFRIELGEIETALGQHPGVREALAILREDEPGDKRLVAYLLVNNRIEQAELTHLLHEKLPAYMVPAAFVQVENWPLTPNGKIDRARLPVPAQATGGNAQSVVAPRSGTEERLARIWQNVLHVQTVGVTDDFFALGGNSLLAIRLVAEIQEQFNQRLALPVLFEQGTIEKLAAILDTDAQLEPLASLVPIQPHGTRPPLFCVHPGSGNVFQYRELARYLDADQPLYAFQDLSVHAEHPAEIAAFLSVESLAERYLQELLDVQPVGPYYLGGYSYGGVVAFEMACELRRMGQEVALLAIFDSATPQAVARSVGAKADEVVLLAIMALELLRATSWTLQSLTAALRSLEPEARQEFALNELRQAGYTLDRTSPALLQQQLRIFQQRHRSLLAYHPPLYDGSIVLVRASEQDATIDDENLLRDLGWSELTNGTVEIYTLLGHHDTLFQEPNIGQVAACIQTCSRRSA